MKTCFIFAAGEDCGLWELPEADDLIIAADGGYVACRLAGITPDVLIGDFDSLDTLPDGIQTLKLPVEKDDTDTMAALRLGLEQGFRRFVIYGGTGGRRPEHMMANLQALSFLCSQEARGWIYGPGWVCTVMEHETVTFPETCRGNFSVFAFGGPATGVTERGFQYTLDRATLRPDFPLGVSNAFTGQPAEISVETGQLLLWYDVEPPQFPVSPHEI